MSSSGHWPQDLQMLTIVLMTALDNRYAPIKSDFSLNSDTYADMSLHELEKKSIKWVVSHKMLVGSSGMKLALAVCGGLPSDSSSTPALSSITYNPTAPTATNSDGFTLALSQKKGKLRPPQKMTSMVDPLQTTQATSLAAISMTDLANKSK